jgi:hypothetical protein
MNTKALCLAVLCGLIGCSGSDGEPETDDGVVVFGVGREPKVGLETALELLKSADAREQDRGLDAVENLEVSREVGLRLIEAAAFEYPNAGSYTVRRAYGRLIRVLWDKPHPDYIPAIEKVWDRIQGRGDAPRAAVRLLCNLGTREALEALVGLLGRPASKSPVLHGSETFGRFEKLESKSIKEHIKDYAE